MIIQVTTIIDSFYLVPTKYQELCIGLFLPELGKATIGIAIVQMKELKFRDIK
jgi:hypothetical protein